MRCAPALRPEYRERFDRDYRAALELAGVLDTVEHWRTRAWITRDPGEHRRVVRRAAELLTGQAPPADEPVAVTKARLSPRRCYLILGRRSSWFSGSG